MDRVTLFHVGRALYPTHDWRARLAANLNINKRSLSRMFAGDTPVPPGIAGELRALVRSQIEELERCLKLLPESQDKA